MAIKVLRLGHAKVIKYLGATTKQLRSWKAGDVIENQRGRVFSFNITILSDAFKDISMIWQGHTATSILDS